MLIGTSCINSLRGGQQLPPHCRKPEESPLPFCSKKPPPHPSDPPICDHLGSPKVEHEGHSNLDSKLDTWGVV